MKPHCPAAAAVVLLTIVQASVAYVVPEVVVMRLKRNPEPMRSFSFSGFNPNGQMAAFTGAADFPMFGNYGPPPQAGPYSYGPPVQESYGPQTQDSYGPPPSGVPDQQQVADPSANKNSYGPAAGGRPEYGSAPSKPVAPNAAPEAAAESGEQSNNVAEPATEGKKQYKGRDGPSSNAEASFNAWFPIMFGVFPNGSGGSGGGLAGGRGQGQGQDQGSSYGANNGGFERSSGSTTVIANSVSNGRNGVSTSHAISYGNPRQHK